VETLQERLRRGEVVALDGGLATSLAAAGHRLGDALWSARVLVDSPASVGAAHAAFIRAGAEVVTTVSYQLAAHSLEASGRDPTMAGDLLRRSVEVARDAVERTPSPRGRPVSVAASVGPFGAVLADGSEYRGGYALSTAQLRGFHAPRVEALVDAAPDLLACETIPAADEIAALAELVAGSGVPTWFSVSVGTDGTTTAEGDPLDEAIAPALAVPEVVAVGVNCCAPTAVPAALATLRSCELPRVVYPNLGDRWDPQSRAWVRDGGGPTGIDPAAWVEAGAQLIGGCCGTSADDVAELTTWLPRTVPT
jgi:homocysteine S-methyltransferase